MGNSEDSDDNCEGGLKQDSIILVRQVTAYSFLYSQLSKRMAHITDIRSNLGEMHEDKAAEKIKKFGGYYWCGNTTSSLCRLSSDLKIHEFSLEHVNNDFKNALDILARSKGHISQIISNIKELIKSCCERMLSIETFTSDILGYEAIDINIQTVPDEVTCKLTEIFN